MEAGSIPGGQGTPAPAAAQPPANGQGDAGQNGGQQPTSADGFRGMFPGIGDEVWPTIEPHLKDVQGRITQLEQLSKPLVEAGLNDPQQVQGLLSFAANYQNNPVGVFLDMAAQLQQAGVIDQDLDLEELQKIATGQGGEPSPESGTATPGTEQPGEVPPWAQELQRTMEETKARQDAWEQETQSRQQQAFLTNALTQAKEALKEAGFPEDAVSDQRIVAEIIAHRGDLKSAIESFTGFKDTVLKSFAEQRNGAGASTLPKGAPPTRPQTTPRNRSGFDAANDKAAQFLRQQNEAAAQG